MNERTGPGLLTILFVVFLVLKLTDTIDWSWWWVTAPIWIGSILWWSLAVVLVVFLSATDHFEKW